MANTPGRYVRLTGGRRSAAPPAGPAAAAPPAAGVSAVVVDGHRVGGRAGLAGEDETRGELVVLQGEVAAHLDLARGDPGPAGAAHPALARERQIGAHVLGGVEDRLGAGGRERGGAAFQDDR